MLTHSSQRHPGHYKTNLNFNRYALYHEECPRHIHGFCLIYIDVKARAHLFRKKFNCKQIRWIKLPEISAVFWDIKLIVSIVILGPFRIVFSKQWVQAFLFRATFCLKRAEKVWVKYFKMKLRMTYDEKSTFPCNATYIAATDTIFHQSFHLINNVGGIICICFLMKKVLWL